MIPPGYAASIHAWAISPELSTEEKAERAASLLAERDALVTGTLNAKAVREMTSGSANGKSFTFDPALTRPEKQVVITDVLMRLGLLAGDAEPVTTTHAAFAYLQR